MKMVGFDLGKSKSHVVVEDESGNVIFNKKINTKRADLIDVFRRFSECKILMEASTSSEWVARLLEGMGNEVIVADPNFGPMYAQRDKKQKTDERDAHALLQALKLSAFRRSVRRSDRELVIKAQLNARTSLVRNRTKLLSYTRAVLQRFGYEHCEKTSPETLVDSLRRNCTEQRLLELLEPVFVVIDATTKQIKLLDEQLEAEADKEPVVKKLEEVPGVGKLVALAFVHAISDVKRFDDGDKVAAYLGLVPSIKASGNMESRGGITKRGDAAARTLLHTAALQIMDSKDPRARSLQVWAEGISHRRGGKKNGGNAKARSALARRLARILFAMWRDNTPFKADLTAHKERISSTANAAE
jgi:transposase